MSLGCIIGYEEEKENERNRETKKEASIYLGRKPGLYKGLSGNTRGVMSDIEDSHGPSDSMQQTPPSYSKSEETLFQNSLENTLIVLLTLSTILNIRVNSFTMKMEILLESTSNKLMVGDLCDSLRIKLVTTGKKRWCDSIRIKLVPGNGINVDNDSTTTPSLAPTSEVPNASHSRQHSFSCSNVVRYHLEQQTDPFPRPSPSPIIPDTISKLLGELEGHSSNQAKEIQNLKAQIKKLKKQAKPVIHHHRAWLKSVSLKQILTRKSFPRNKRCTKSLYPNKGGSLLKVTKEQIRSAATESMAKEKSILPDHLKNQAKQFSREKEKLESDEEMARKMQEEWEGKEKRNRIAEEKAANEALIRNFDEKRQGFEGKKRSRKEKNKNPFLAKKLQGLNYEVSEDFISIGSAEDERLIKRMNEKGVDSSEDEMIKEESKEKVKKESKAEVQEESKEEESKRKRKLGTRKKMKSRKRRYIQNTSGR
ncbi:hypothetical protein Tco_0214886 [Tanacetum coccineum]